MKVEKVQIQVVFEKTQQLEAPLYQRPYVWGRERNWEPLWEAIRLVADRLLSGGDCRPHFLGTVVLEQRRTTVSRVDTRQIIDGQQRLTTLQLAMAAARDLCAELGETNYAKAFGKLAVNDCPLSTVANDQFKIWPTNADRADFESVMLAGSRQAVAGQKHADPDDEWLVPDAYLYFSGEFAEWLGAPLAAQFHERLQTLHRALTQELHLVVI